MDSDTIKSHYNYQAKTKGGFKKKFPHTSQFPHGEDPEEIFENLVKKYGSKEKIGLDLGCGDGRKTIQFAAFYKKVFGVDFSEEMIKIAKKEFARNNIEYLVGEAKNLPIKADSIDVAWSRRGPTLGKEMRVLKKKSFYIQIKIAHKDCLELKETFGRGQGMDMIGIDDLQELIDLYQKAGFKITLAKRYQYASFYKEAVFISFLKYAPILVDFDLKQDKEPLEKYLKKFMNNGIVRLNREKILFVAEKDQLNDEELKK